MKDKLQVGDQPQGLELKTNTADEMNRWLLENLDQVASLGETFRNELDQSWDPASYIQATKPILKRLLNFQAMAFFMVDEDMDFQMMDCEPAEERELIVEELNHQIKDGTFTWVLYLNRPIILVSKIPGKRILLHVLATRKRVRGMFLGILDETYQFIPDAIQKLITIVLTNCSSFIENSELYNELNNYTGELEKANETLKQEMAERKQLEEQLRHAQKMEAIGQLAGGVAHDFNNLLAAIIGFSEIGVTSAAEEATVVDSFNRIIRKSQQGAKLVSQLLAFSRKQLLEVKPINLNDVVEEASYFYHRVIGEDIELINELDPKLATIEADPTALNQIITNLFVNARDAMPVGGRLGIRTMNVSLDDKFCAIHSGTTPGNYVKLTVADTGVGMDEETQTQIFDPFFTTKERWEGAGLGLSMVFGLVKQHGGYINCTSEVGKGTTFELYFPIIIAQPEKEVKTDDLRILGGQETILFVEDDPDVIMASQIMLERCGYTVLTAQNGMEALKKYKDNQAVIDLVITDIILPKLGGIELHKAIHEINPEVKFLFVSGYAASGAYEKFRLDPDLELLQKPFLAKEITTKVRKLIDK